jgi:hypothetical protein
VNFGRYFSEKMRPTPKKICPTPKNIAQMAKIRPIWSHCLLTKPFDWVARWFILRPKIPIWVYFEGPWNGKCWYIFRPFGIIYIWPFDMYL